MVRLFRALCANLQEEGLSFPLLDAEGSGKRMLTALSLALQYVLPFDLADPSPLRLAGRVHLAVPKRFCTEVYGDESGGLGPRAPLRVLFCFLPPARHP